MQHAEMTGTELAELIPQDKVRPPQVALPRSLIAKRRRVHAISVRSWVCALAFFLAGAALFLFAGLFTLAFLVDEHCGTAFGYYGCDIFARL
jgi:hypothetical protein